MIEFEVERVLVEHIRIQCFIEEGTKAREMRDSESILACVENSSRICFFIT